MSHIAVCTAVGACHDWSWCCRSAVESPGPTTVSRALSMRSWGCNTVSRALSLAGLSKRTSQISCLGIQGANGGLVLHQNLLQRMKLL